MPEYICFKMLERFHMLEQYWSRNNNPGPFLFPPHYYFSPSCQHLFLNWNFQSGSSPEGLEGSHTSFSGEVRNFQACFIVRAWFGLTPVYKKGELSLSFYISPLLSLKRGEKQARFIYLFFFTLGNNSIQTSLLSVTVSQVLAIQGQQGCHGSCW